MVKKQLRVLVACEFSGIVREAFRCSGHDAVSCDLIPTEIPGPHYQGNVLDLIYKEKWDLMIAHPPCTYLTVSGNRWFKDNPERYKLQVDALAFVKALWEAPIKHIAIENPIGRLSTLMCRPTQIIQPWQFGHGETKATCLWLKNLPKLTPTNIVDERINRIHMMPGSKDQAKNRSRTYTGIADAMAKQWSNL